MTVTELGIPNSVTSIGALAFSRSGLTSITIPSSVTSIGANAFFETVWFYNQPDGLVYAGLVAYTYKGTIPGTSITIAEGTLGIADYAFSNCRELASITIPNSLTHIGSSAFMDCSGLTSISIPNSVTFIGDDAFSGCYGLTSITIPNSVTTIAHSAFEYCRGLSSISVESGNPNYDSRDNCNAIIETAANTLIVGCMNTTIPNSVTSIGTVAFYGCRGLTSISIPNSVTSIGDFAFYDCYALTSVTCLATMPPVTYNYTFSGVNTSQATLYVPMESVELYQAANYWKNFHLIVGIPIIEDFEEDGVYYHALTDSTVIVITRPGEDYYSGDVVIPESVTHDGYTFNVISIDVGAFEDCYDLASVEIGDAVETIGENAFQGCTGMTSVTIGSGVTTIEEKAFNYCNALQTVTCRGMIPPVMANTNCFSTATYNRAKLLVPRKALETYQYADYWYKFNSIEGWGSIGPGDVNADGIISISDVTVLINLLLSADGEYNADADLNHNGRMDIADVASLIDSLLND